MPGELSMDVAQQIKERHCYTCGDLVKVSTLLLTRCGVILGSESRSYDHGCVGAHSLYQQRQHSEMLAACEDFNHERTRNPLLSKISIHSLAALKARLIPRGCVSAQQACIVRYEGLPTPELSPSLD